MMNCERSDGGHKDAGSYSGKNEYDNGYHSKVAANEHTEPMGYAVWDEKPVLTREVADRWMKSLKNEDGTTGPHWTMEQTKQVQAQRGIDCEPLEFWVAANAVYSDYFGVAKEMDVNNIDFYAKMARAWLHDDDAMPDKAARYYDYIVKH